MKFSVITVNFNGDRYLEKTMKSVLGQKAPQVDLEYIVIDGGSTDNSINIIEAYRPFLSHVIVEPDKGPVDALNKGLHLAKGEIISWLNSDDCYTQHALSRVAEAMHGKPDIPFCFGRCRIVDEHDIEIRKNITRFKECFFPFSSRFVYQCINYISQPALFFRREALQNTNYLDDKLIAAWDYKFFLQLWQQGKGLYVKGEPLAQFRWHSSSISGSNFVQQFREEYLAAKEDAGTIHPATWIHFFVQWMIISAYSLMAHRRKTLSAPRKK